MSLDDLITLNNPISVGGEINAESDGGRSTFLIKVEIIWAQDPPAFP